MVTKTVAPSRNRPITDLDGRMEQEFTSWTQSANNTIPILGTGNPEGVVEARAGAEFIDQTVSVTPYLYKKQLDEIGGDRTKGWRTVA